MALFDWPLETLRNYLPECAEPSDFDQFWQDSIASAEAHELDVSASIWPGDLALVQVYDIEFSGFEGDRIKAWLLMPRHSVGPLPAVVQYVGYGGGRGTPYDWLNYAVAGYAHFVMDTRGQGGGGSITSDTADVPHFPLGPSSPGFLTRGIEDPKHHYYRRLIVDAVRAVEAVQSLASIDSTRVAVAGTSQGGGIALAVGALRPDLAAVITDVPFLSNFERACALTDVGPYAEVARFLSGNRFSADAVMNTLSYFDVVNFASRSTVPAWFSAALMDRICPPSTIFAAYNHYRGEKDIAVFPFNGHEGGGSYGLPRKLAALRSRFG